MQFLLKHLAKHLGMGDIDSVTGVNLVQLENRQLKIGKLKKLQM